MLYTEILLEEAEIIRNMKEEVFFDDMYPNASKRELEEEMESWDGFDF